MGKVVRKEMCTDVAFVLAIASRMCLKAACCDHCVCSPSGSNLDLIQMWTVQGCLHVIDNEHVVPPETKRLTAPGKLPSTNMSKIVGVSLPLLEAITMI